MADRPDMTRKPVILVTMLLTAVGAVTAVMLLQGQATASRDSELRMSSLQLQLREMQDIPWDAAPGRGATVSEVRVRFGQARLRFDRRLSAEIRRGIAADQLTRVRRPFDEMVEHLGRIPALAASDKTLEGSRAAGEAWSAGEQGHAALTAAADAYRAHATRSLAQALYGSGAAITLLFLAFACFLRRAERARHRAEELAEDKQDLLERMEDAAHTDALTGLANRRALAADLDAAATRATAEAPMLLVLFDLDGFKAYNDTFGHPAGDALLSRLGERLRETTAGLGRCYRMGGDEFCLLAEVAPGEGEGIVRMAAAALSESGEAFEIGCSYGVALLPTEGATPEAALGLADQRMYRQKTAGRASAGRQTVDALVQVLSERDLELKDHIDDVAGLSSLTARTMGLDEHEVEVIRMAAELHDVGKAAIPDAILKKPGPLDEQEWAFMRRHTVIGERIVRAAPALADAAKLVRSGHERIDGAGYPDGLRGDDIPLGSRIVAVCDAYHAMVSDRPYRAAMPGPQALEELRRCSGTQFDTEVVDAFIEVVRDCLADRSRPSLAS